MPSRLLMHELTRSELSKVAPETLVIFPVGATEQHGPHLPIATDSWAVEHIARAAAAKAGKEIPVLVAPTLPFGSSHHHLPFGGTMSLSTQVYYQAIYELTESLIIDGFRRIFILNGHGGNHEVIQLAARDVALKHPANVAAASYWMAAWDHLVATGAHKDGNLPGHAGSFETSLMMALRPDLIPANLPHRDGQFEADARGFAAPVREETHGWWQSIDGYTDSPDQARAEWGDRYLAAITEAVAGAFVSFYR